jgi:hypothetical protein
MQPRGVLALLDIDGVVREGDCLDLAELSAAEVAELGRDRLRHWEHLSRVSGWVASAGIEASCMRHCGCDQGFHAQRSDRM